ncbi:ABC transporter permease [Paenibacillus sp. OV219]|uniref:ABC transporter permease n=1 Tax=Paenibacillus sp. OV219 TaxID=1884377 RepID=UPI0008B3194E|nr:ABC transporter permease [Paenibacillus sp. OV219]SEM72505.1 ABC-2 type transport system permease protein [Paenibacillus sp. OV219]
MVNLILNENMKIYRRTRTWVMIAVMIVIVLFGSFIDWHYDDKETGQATWQQQLTERNQQNAKLLTDEKLDQDDKERIQENIDMNQYQLDHNIHPEGSTMWSGINGSAQLVLLITLFTVIIAGDSLAGEFSSGTIKLLLIRPASRLKILISKYVSMIMFGLLLLVILFIVSVLFNGLLYRFENMNLPLLHLDTAGHIVEKNMFANLWQSYLLNGVSTIIFVTMAFMISSAFRSSTMAIGFSLFALFAGAILMELLHDYDWSRYILFANINLSGYLTGHPYQKGMTLAFSIKMLAAYYLVFSLVAWLVFTKRDVAA